MATAKKKTEAVTEDAPKAPKVTGATSGVMAVGKAGRAAREASHAGSVPTISAVAGTWRDPDAKFAENDPSIDARMARLTRELRG